MRLNNKTINNSMETKQVLKEKKEQEWLKENKEAIDEYNKRIEKYGCFSDGIRRF